MREIWKKVHGFSNYEFSNLGRIKTLNWKNSKQTTIMIPNVSQGYYKTILVNDLKEYKSILVHRMVAIAFICNPENKKEVNHINGNKLDNSIDNLEWCTRQENMSHAYDNNLVYILKGSEIGNSVLKEYQVLEIRKKFIPRVYSRVKLAKEYGVSEATIKDILYKRTWNHI